MSMWVASISSIWAWFFLILATGVQRMPYHNNNTSNFCRGGVVGKEDEILFLMGLKKYTATPGDVPGRYLHAQQFSLRNNVGPY